MRLLVNAPTGLQELIEVGEGGGYFDPNRVLWDERVDGTLPDITLGGMVRSGNAMAFDQARMDAHTAALQPGVPQVVTMRQFRAALIELSMDEEIETFLAAASGMDGRRARADYVSATEVERDWPLMLQMAAAMGKTQDDIDQVMTLAQTL